MDGCLFELKTTYNTKACVWRERRRNIILSLETICILFIVCQGRGGKERREGGGGGRGGGVGVRTYANT